MLSWKNKGLFAKTFYSLNGFTRAFVSERSVRQESAAAVAAPVLAAALGKCAEDIFSVFLAALFPLVIELVNTAVEEVIDTLYGPAYREDVRRQKDMLSAAVLLSLFIGYGVCLKIMFF
ncbi:MAG: diacylglycerol kinase [Synergistes sp.]|nr:diacylglycerol kinase [Synergistes sp.]